MLEAAVEREVSNAVGIDVMFRTEEGRAAIAHDQWLLARRCRLGVGVEWKEIAVDEAFAVPHYSNILSLPFGEDI